MRLTRTALLGVFAFATTCISANDEQDQFFLGKSGSTPVQWRPRGREQLRQRGATYIDRAPLRECPFTVKSKTVLGKYIVHLFPGYDLKTHVDAVGEELKVLGIRVQERGDGEQGIERVVYEVEDVNNKVIERVYGESGVEWVGCVNEGTVEEVGQRVEGEWDVDGEGLLVWRRDNAVTGQEEGYLAQMNCQKPGYLMKFIEGEYMVDLWPGVSLDEHLAVVNDARLKPADVEWISKQASKYDAEHIAYGAGEVSDELLLAIRKDKNVEHIRCITTTDPDQKDTEEGRLQAIREWEEEHYTPEERQRKQDWIDIYDKYESRSSMTIQEKIDADRAWYGKYPQDFEKLDENMQMRYKDWFELFDGWDGKTAEERSEAKRRWMEKYPLPYEAKVDEHKV